MASAAWWSWLSLKARPFLPRYWRGIAPPEMDSLAVGGIGYRAQRGQPAGFAVGSYLHPTRPILPRARPPVRPYRCQPSVAPRRSIARDWPAELRDLRPVAVARSKVPFRKPSYIDCPRSAGWRDFAHRPDWQLQYRSGPRRMRRRSRHCPITGFAVADSAGSSPPKSVAPHSANKATYIG